MTISVFPVRWQVMSYNGVRKKGMHSLPRDGLVAAFLVANDLEDSIGLLITPGQIREELRPIFFDGEARRTDEATIILIEASEYLNNGWELTGNAEDGYAVFLLGTTEAILRKAYRFFGEPYAPAIPLRYLNTSHYTNTENYA